MSAEFTIDLIEEKGALVFTGGSALAPLQVGHTFSQLLQDGKKATARRKLGNLTLRIEAIFLDGEPVEALEANQAGLLALAGDATLLLETAQKLRWRKKNSRLLRTSDDALTLVHPE